MNDTNYIGGIVKILEIPNQKKFNSDVPVVKIRGQLPQFRDTKIITLTFWDTLACDILDYYKVNDYILIEGFLSLQAKKSSQLSQRISKKIEINVLKIYPLFFSSNSSIERI